MGRRKDPCWEHAKNLSTGSDVSFQCTYCLETYKGGASRLKAHLSGKKNGGIGPCPKVPDDVVEKLFGRKRASPDMENENVPCSLPSSLDRNLRPRVLEEKKDKRWVDDKLVSFLTVFDLPFELVKSHIFSDFVKAVAQYGSDYELPDSKTFYGLRRVYDSRVESYVNKVERSLVEVGCTLMVGDDGALCRYSPCGMLCQRATIEDLDNGTERSDDRTERSDNGTERSDDGILRIINTCVNPIDQRKVLQIFSDYDPLSSDLKNSLIGRYQWMNVGNSPAHGIMKLSQDIFGRDRVSQTLCLAYAFTTGIDNYWTCARIDEEKNFADYPFFYQLLLREKIVEFWTLKSLLKFKYAGQGVVARDTIDFTEDTKSYVDHLIHCEKFWVQAKEWVSVLQPLLEAFFLTSNKMYPASAYLFQIMEKVRVAIAKCCHIGQDDIKRLVHLFAEFRDTVMHPMYAAAAFFNPAYIYSKSFEEHGELRRGIDFIRSCLVKTDEKETFMGEFNHYRLKDPDIFTTIAKSGLESYHPATWWKYYGDCVPTLQKYAIRILSQPCNSFYCHELNLKRRFAQNYWHHVDALMMEKFEKLETQMLRAIDVNNIGLPEWLNEYGTRDRPLEHHEIWVLKDTLEVHVPRGCLPCGHLPRNG